MNNNSKKLRKKLLRKLNWTKIEGLDDEAIVRIIDDYLYGYWIAVLDECPGVSDSRKKQICEYMCDFVREGIAKEYITLDNYKYIIERLTDGIQAFKNVTGSTTYGSWRDNQLGINIYHFAKESDEALRHEVFHEMAHCITPVLDGTEVVLSEESESLTGRLFREFKSKFKKQEVLNVGDIDMKDADFFFKEIIAESIATDLDGCYQDDVLVHQENTGITSNWLTPAGAKFQVLGDEFLQTLSFINTDENNTPELRFRALSLMAINGDNLYDMIVDEYKNSGLADWKKDLASINRFLSKFALQKDRKLTLSEVSQFREIIGKYIIGRDDVVEDTLDDESLESDFHLSKDVQALEDIKLDSSSDSTLFDDESHDYSLEEDVVVGGVEQIVEESVEGSSVVEEPMTEESVDSSSAVEEPIVEVNDVSREDGKSIAEPGVEEHGDETENLNISDGLRESVDKVIDEVFTKATEEIGKPDKVDIESHHMNITSENEVNEGSNYEEVVDNHRSMNDDQSVNSDDISQEESDVRRPRERGLFETDDEYLDYLIEFYSVPSHEESLEDVTFESVSSEVQRPRERGLFETDDEYVAYLERFYNGLEERAICQFSESDFDSELIIGTDIRRPRERGIFETDDDYLVYLENFYKACFGEEQSSNQSDKIFRK